MLDINFIKDNVLLLKKVASNKGVDIDLDNIISLDNKRRRLQKQADDLRHQHKIDSGNVAIQKDDKIKKKLINKVRSKKNELENAQKILLQIENELRDKLLLVPNIYSDDTPVGKNESSNKEVARFGEIPKFPFKPKSHIELGESLGLLDFKRGAKVAGFRGYFLKNELAILHGALLWHVFKKMRDKGFEVMIPPITVKEFALIGSGHFPAERKEIYEIEEYSEKEKEAKFLSGTSEVSLLAFRAGETLNEKELPLKYCGWSSCFRKEVGGYGKDVKGLYRIHEFSKIEQVVISKNDLNESLKLFEEIKDNALEVLNELKLPHRILQICTGDMGAGKYKMYDIETWMPSRGAFGETHSNSHLTDWQARRLNMRYKTKQGKIMYPHTMNNTAIASPRILIAIMENYQNKDGSITVPAILQPYCGFNRIPAR